MAPGCSTRTPSLNPMPFAELVEYAERHDKGMVGSCIIRTDRLERVFTRGLEWNRIAARDIEENARFLRENFGDVRMSTFAFPFGDMDLPSKLTLQQRFAACRSSVLRLTKGFPTTGDCASRKGWKLMRTSRYLLKIGRGWKAGWRAATRRKSWSGGRGSS
jgi:hypothetical protein